MTATHVDQEPCTTLGLPHHVDSVQVARLQMADELRAADMPRQLIADAELVLHELVANAVTHGKPNATGEVEVSWCVRGTSLHISVVDGGDIAELKAVPAAPDAGHGRGLYIVDYLCDTWSNDNHEGVRVTAELRLP
jgi:anti-sigma regulatory factor (Ser/Thr protein kinase)